MIRLCIAAVLFARSIASAQSPTHEQLTCGDTLHAMATYRRATVPSIADTVSGVVVQIASVRSVRPLTGVDIQLWGPTGAVGGPADSSGTTVYEDRSPGLYRIQVRGLPNQRATWRYAATLRAGYRDTIVIDLDVRCSLPWRGK